jgi:hypothetical protein
VGNLIDLESEPPEKDKVTSLIMDNVPHDLIMAPLHPVNTGSSPHQQLAATGGGASPPSPSASKPPRDAPVGNLIDCEPEPPEKDKVTSLIMDDVPAATGGEASHIAPDSHRQHVQTSSMVQRSESTEKDSPNRLSSSSSCSMEYTNIGDDKSNRSRQGSANQDGKNDDLIMAPLHTVNTGSSPHQQLAATGGGASHIAPDSHRQHVQTSSMVRRSDSTEKENLSTSFSVSSSSGVSSVIRGLPKTVISALSIEDEVTSCRRCGGQLHHGEEFCSQSCAVKYWKRLRRQNGKASGTY